MIRSMQANQYKTINADQSFNSSEDFESQPIWEIIIKIGAEIADEEWATIPPDLSKNIDSGRLE